jgi:hypothetical protein
MSRSPSMLKTVFPSNTLKKSFSTESTIERPAMDNARTESPWKFRISTSFSTIGHPNTIHFSPVFRHFFREHPQLGFLFHYW